LISTVCRTKFTGSPRRAVARCKKLREVADALKYFLKPQHRRCAPYAGGRQGSRWSRVHVRRRTKRLSNAGSRHARGRGGIAPVRPAREFASRTGDFHIRIKPSYFQDGARATTDESSRRQFSSRHGGDARRFANG